LFHFPMNSFVSSTEHIICRYPHIQDGASQQYTCPIVVPKGQVLFGCSHLLSSQGKSSSFVNNPVYTMHFIHSYLHPNTRELIRLRDRCHLVQSNAYSPIECSLNDLTSYLSHLYNNLLTNIQQRSKSCFTSCLLATQVEPLAQHSPLI
jgi:hypothetical protein